MESEKPKRVRTLLLLINTLTLNKLFFNLIGGVIPEPANQE